MPTSRGPSGPRRPYAGEAREQRVARRRAAFIAAGRALFGSVGYRRTTVRALCAEAGLTDRYFYESFASMEDLLIAVYEALMDDMQSRVVAALQSGGAEQDADARIAAGLDAYFQQVEDHTLARVVWLEVLGVSPLMDAIYLRRTRDFADLLLSLGRSLAPNLDVPDGTARVVALGLVGAASEAARHWLMSDYLAPRAEQVAGVALVFSGVWRSTVAQPRGSGA